MSKNKTPQDEQGTVREIVVEETAGTEEAVERIEPTDEDIIKAMADAAFVIRKGAGTHDRRGVEARARELLAMLTAFQDIYKR